MPADLHWKQLLALRPNFAGASKPIQISDALAQTRHGIASSDLLDFLYFGSDERGKAACGALRLIGAVVEAGTDSEDAVEGEDLWARYDWQLSIRTFLWSMRDEFVDHGHDYDEKRCAALTALLESEPLPLPERIREEEATVLPAPAELPGEVSVGAVLSSRRTATRFRRQPMDAAILAGVLLHGFMHSRRFHIPDIAEDVRNILQGCGFAIDPYLVIYDVGGVGPGIYRYSVSEDRMTLLRPGCYRSTISDCLIGHRESETASFTILLAAEFERFQWRYRHERALRNLYVDVGRMAQFFILVATGYGLATHLTPACRDDQLSELLSLDPDRHQVLHTVTVGLRV